MFEKTLDFLQKHISACFMILGFASCDIFLRYYTNDEIGFYDIHHLAPLFFTLFHSCMLTLIFYTLPRHLGRILYTFVSLVFNLYACGQIIYFKLFDNFIWFKDIAFAGEGSDYASYVISLIDNHIIVMFLFSFICMIFALIFFPKTDFSWKSLGIKAVLAGCLCLFYASIPDMIGEKLKESRWDAWQYPRNIYDQFTNQTFMMQVSGFYEYMARDFVTTYITGNQIDDGDYEQIVSYLESMDEIEENEMTGLFEGKNVIMVMMESIDDWLINETYTPTIKMMMDQGINFTAHYAPIFSSGATFNTEFTSNVGSYSPNGGNAAYSFSKNDYSQSLPNLFKAQGYTANSFHYNFPTYYNRAVMHQAFGYENYYSTIEMSDYYTAIIDTSLIELEDSYSNMVSEEPFFSYVITYSAHLPYSVYTDVCSYAMDHDSRWNYNWNDELNCAHLVSAITDDFFAALLDRLEEDNLLENTVIVAFADHYTYGFSDAEMLKNMSDASGAATVDQVPFFIYDCSESIEPKVVDKVNSTIDILPTVANLFNLDYNKYYIGKDIFDPRYTGLTYFKDYSWYDGHTYYANGQVVLTDGMTDIEAVNEKVSKNIQIGELIITDDFFNFYKPENRRNSENE